MIPDEPTQALPMPLYGVPLLSRLMRYGGSLVNPRPQASYDREARKCAANAAARRKLNAHRKHKAKSDKRHGKKAKAS